MSSPRDAILAVTFRCNAHCVMCNAWQSRRADALRPEHVRKLPPDLRTVNLTGGEPFLRDDLPAFVGELRARCPRARITISTNASLPERVERMMDEIVCLDPAVRLAVSLDGVGAAHDRVRGIEGAFDAAVGVIDRLRAKGFGGLRLGMTLSAANADQLAAVAGLAESRGLEVGVVCAHAATLHLGVEEVPAAGPSPALREQFRAAIGRWLRSPRPRQWLRAHFADRTYRRLLGWRAPRPCGAGEESFFVQADGSVHGCSVRGPRMGSLVEQDWEAIWRGRDADAARAFAARCGEGCWMICTARRAYRARPLSVAGWVLLHKLAAHLGWVPLPAGAGGAAEAAGERPCANPAR